ncbi:hypothetical protein AVEN_215729-1 [Araneus ventricosus]|uniref:Secreted protein n=1 Tax=Araneus ventricosus TaxID=182803 RepID=A0A4Y2FJZ5_ARAVE|nr:hypothetical protein AVEN_215729-1 [Araneus ventricosus]
MNQFQRLFIVVMALRGLGFPTKSMSQGLAVKTPVYGDKLPSWRTFRATGPHLYFAWRKTRKTSSSQPDRRQQYIAKSHIGLAMDVLPVVHVINRNTCLIHPYHVCKERWVELSK